MTYSPPVSRRGFLKVSAAFGAFSLGFHLPAVSGARATADAKAEINAWITIHPDDTVILLVARSEMGQGSLTGLAQLIAEELDCDWSKLRTEYVLPSVNVARSDVWGDMQTGGSGSIRESHEMLRQAGAAARTLLVAAAASKWAVPVAECTAARSLITHTPSGRAVTYGAVSDLAATLPLPDNVNLKQPGAWSIVGQSLPRLDTADKLNGKQVYGIDLVLDGMLCAAIRACPVAGGRLVRFDESVIAAKPGVRRVVRVGDNAVAVVADRWWQAKTALDDLPVMWDEGNHANLSSTSIAELLTKGFDDADPFVGMGAGDAPTAIAKAGRKISAEYSYPYQAHAAMEPINATALYTPERCQVWAPTQNATAALQEASLASGLPLDRCEVYRMHIGGGFGRRLYQDYVAQAVTIAKAMPGTPIKLIWSREEDFTHDMYHPTTRCRLTGALDEHGNVTALHMSICGQSIRATWAPQRVSGNRDPHMFHGLTDDTFGYAIPDLRIDYVMRNPAVRPGAWRGVHLNQNMFYRECFIDELAQAAGRDPFEFRRSLLAGHPKHLGVLETVAAHVGWKTPPRAGVHRGIAVANGYGSYVAAVAEVSVSAGRLTIHKIVCATDVGHAVNPEQLKRQAEGACVFGLSAALFGECTVEGGVIQQTNFDSYEVMRLADMPEIETIVLQSGDFWGGGGEPPIAVATPAVLNAVFAATGTRVRDLPLKNVNIGS